MPTLFSALARFAGIAPASPPETKLSAVAPLIAMQYQRQPIWSPRDYAAFAREGFTQNPVVYRCVRMVAEAAASVPLDLFEGGALIESHPLLDLLQAPNPTQTRPDLLESWYGFLLVAGNAYIEAVGVGSDVRELYVLRPDRMQIVPGVDGWPLSYDYTVNGQTVSFSGEVVPGVRKVMHLGLFHPSKDYYGLSPIEAAATAIDIHNAASAWNKAMLDNSALPSGALVYNAGDRQLTPEQYERLKVELEASFQGARNAGRPMLLEGGLDWRAMSMTPKDMDFIESKRQAARDISLALGVPPMLLGIPGDNRHDNFEEANRSFWRQTVLPLVGRTMKAVAGWLGPAYGGGLELRPDLDAIEALSTERDALWSRVDKATFLTTAEKRTAVGYGADAAEGDGAVEDKFNPGQPRLPGGQTGGGRWTDDPSSGYGDLLHPVQSSGRSGYPVDLTEEDTLGGHTIDEHVNKSLRYLSDRVRAEAKRILDRGDGFSGLAIGSFTSLEAATKLVNSTISQNQAIVDQVVRGLKPFGVLKARFDSPTGYEIYLASSSSQPYERGTYGVTVFILPDGRVAKGYRVQSAYPKQ